MLLTAVMGLVMVVVAGVSGTPYERPQADEGHVFTLEEVVNSMKEVVEVEKCEYYYPHNNNKNINNKIITVITHRSNNNSNNNHSNNNRDAVFHFFIFFSSDASGASISPAERGLFTSQSAALLGRNAGC